VAILSDEGYPQPPITAPEFEAAIGVKVHRVARLEPWILTHREGSFDDLVTTIHDEATQAAADPNCVAFKSIVAYRTGHKSRNRVQRKQGVGVARSRQCHRASIARSVCRLGQGWHARGQCTRRMM
jgi:hypothetical protein